MEVELQLAHPWQEVHVALPPWLEVPLVQALQVLVVALYPKLGSQDEQVVTLVVEVQLTQPTHAEQLALPPWLDVPLAQGEHPATGSNP